MNLSNYFIVSDKNKKSNLLKSKILKLIKPVSLSNSNIIIVIGGDGFMLRNFKESFIKH